MVEGESDNILSTVSVHYVRVYAFGGDGDVDVDSNATDDGDVGCFGSGVSGGLDIVAANHGNIAHIDTVDVGDSGIGSSGIGDGGFDNVGVG